MDRCKDPGCFLRGKVLRHDRERTVDAVLRKPVEVFESGRPSHLMGSEVPRPHTDLTGIERRSKRFKLGGETCPVLGSTGVRRLPLVLRFWHFHIHRAQFYLILHRRFAVLGDCIQGTTGSRMQILPSGPIVSGLRSDSLPCPRSAQAPRGNCRPTTQAVSSGAGVAVLQWEPNRYVGIPG
jgi:hypothetical protein